MSATAKWARALEAADLAAKSRTHAQAFQSMGRAFSADLATDFADALEAGAPAGMYRHWITEQGARVQDIRGRDAALMRARGVR